MSLLRLTLLLAAAALGASPQALGAGLEWERTSVEVAALPGQRVVRVNFPFRNAGDKLVTITSVETSCRCTSADTSKKSYSPGESDVLAVDFAVGDQDGVVVQSVTVTTDGPELNPFTLTLRVAIPRPPPPK